MRKLISLLAMILLLLSVCVAWVSPPFCFGPAWPEVNALRCGWAFPSEAVLPLPVRQPLFRL